MTHSGPAPCTEETPSLAVVPYGHPEARRLMRELHAEQIGVYGFADDPDETPHTEFAPPRGMFLIADAGEQGIVGCGGWRVLAPEVAEIKRMYVSSRARGQGLGRRILEFLEEQARSRGATRIVLETGADNTSALALYTSCGYAPRPPYVPGRKPEVNRAMGKSLIGSVGASPSSRPDCG